MKITLSVVFVFILLQAVTFCQEVNSGFMGFAGVGIGIPASNKEFAKLYLAGLNINGAGAYIINMTYAIRLDLQYNNFPYHESDPNYAGKFISYSITGNFLAGDFGRNSTMNPYGMFGIGAFVNSEKFTHFGVSRSTNVVNLGLGVGGGVNIKATEKIGMFTEFQYMLMFHQGSANAYVLAKSGVKFRN